MPKLQKNKWKNLKLGEVCEFVRGPFGGTLKKEIFVKSGYAIYEQSHAIYNQFDEVRYFIDEDKFNEMKRFQVKHGDLIMSCSGTFGKVAIIPEGIQPGVINQALLKLTCKSALLNNFLFLWMNSENFQNELNANVHGTAIKNIASISVFKNLEIPLPPLEEQKKIADLFQNIEQSIIRAEEQEANLLKLKNQLLRELFGGKKQFGNYLNAKDFEKVKFEKIALSISEHVEPKQTALEVYVGLDHLDSDDLVIRRKGKPEDVIGTKLKIYKDDVIFGKRRAYLRKVAVSDFEGIVSAHSMVLRANQENIEKDLLPYFMQSDEFMNRAVQISEGSLSPTIKWKTLAQQEFILPKKEKQAKLIDIFKHFDETRELVHKQIETLKKLKQKLLNEILGG